MGPLNDVIDRRLVSDSETVCRWGDLHCDEVIELEYPRVEKAAAEIEETAIARFFSTAIEQSLQVADNELLILHSHGLFQAWDAPYRYRLSLTGDDDPPPPLEVSLEAIARLEGDASDRLLGWQQAYAAQLLVVDHCLELFLRTLESQFEGGSLPLICVTAPRSFPVGEHQRFGAPESCLYDDALHVPLFLLLPDAAYANIRSQNLVYAHHWTDWARAWFNHEPWPRVPVLPNRKQEILLSRNQQGDIALRTHSWKLLTDTQPPKLFAKPDDRWEMNDVANRCHDVVEALTEMASDRRLPSEDFPLSDILANGMV